MKCMYSCYQSIQQRLSEDAQPLHAKNQYKGAYLQVADFSAPFLEYPSEIHGKIQMPSVISEISVMLELP